LRQHLLAEGLAGAEILGAAIDYFRQGQVSLRPLKVGKTVAGSAGKGG